MHRKHYIAPALTLALASCMLLIGPHSAQAKSPIMNDWQAHYNPCAPLNQASCTVCHMNGTDFNDYGLDLKIRIGDQGMANVAAFVDAESVDSDGDSYSNGQEIVVDCTFPGDDTSHGTVATTVTAWGQIKALYR